MNRKQAMWVLAENFFAPLVFINLIKDRGLGLGSELQGRDCWYFPVERDGGTLKPIQRVLDCWLRVIGFRTAYGISHEMKGDGESGDALRKFLERCLSGKEVPKVDRLHALVDEFHENAKWLDAAEHWKTRFTIACGMQSLSEEMDEFFADVQPQPSLRLLDTLEKISSEGVICDDEFLLAQDETFFAARLLQRRWQSEGVLESKLGACLSSPPPTFPIEPSMIEDERVRAEIFWRSNRGNLFLEAIKNEYGGGHGRGDDLGQRLLEVGIAELNRILDSNRVGRRGARQP